MLLELLSLSLLPLQLQVQLVSFVPGPRMRQVSLLPILGQGALSFLSGQPRASACVTDKASRPLYRVGSRWPMTTEGGCSRRSAPQCLIVLLLLQEVLLQLAQQNTQPLGLGHALLLLTALLRQHEDDLQCGQVAMLWAPLQALSQPCIPQRGWPGPWEPSTRWTHLRAAAHPLSRLCG